MTISLSSLKIISFNLKKERIKIMPGKTSREELLNKIEKTAHDYEKEFHGCSRCVFKALQDHLDLGDGTSTSLKASTPLAAGVAMRGETCGALIGGLLAVGIITAQEDLKNSNALNNSLAAGFRLARKVEKEFGTTNCTKMQTDRLGRFYSLADPEQYKAFIEAGGYVECPKVVGKIARMTAEFIMDYLDKKKN
jgi:C_GCAxxG_C_C family probable redox protein